MIFRGKGDAAAFAEALKGLLGEVRTPDLSPELAGIFDSLLERNGLRIALLGYCGFPPKEFAAGEKTPGTVDVAVDWDWPKAETFPARSRE